MQPTGDRWLERNGWGPEPDLWRPLAGESWPDPLPDPVDISPSEEGRMTLIGRVGFSATDAAALAAEMEHNRNRRKIEGEVEETAQIPWWRAMREAGRDVPWTYSAAGAISPRECRWRVMRAVYWLGGNRIAGPRCQTFAQALAARMPIALAEDIDAAAPLDLPALVRHESETDDRLLTAMGWVADVASASELDLLIAMTIDRQMTQRRLADALSRAGTEWTVERTQRVERSVFTALHKVANGFAMSRRKSARDAVIESNRAFRRAQHTF